MWEFLYGTYLEVLSHELSIFSISLNTEYGYSTSIFKYILCIYMDWLLKWVWIIFEFLMALNSFGFLYLKTHKEGLLPIQWAKIPPQNNFEPIWLKLSHMPIPKPMIVSKVMKILTSLVSQGHILELKVVGCPSGNHTVLTEERQRCAGYWNNRCPSQHTQSLGLLNLALSGFYFTMLNDFSP